MSQILGVRKLSGVQKGGMSSYLETLIGWHDLRLETGTIWKIPHSHLAHGVGWLEGWALLGRLSRKPSCGLTMWLGFLTHGLGSEKEVLGADSPRDHMEAHDLRSHSRSHIVSYMPYGLADAVTACLTEREVTQMQYLEGRSGKDIVILFFLIP